MQPSKTHCPFCDTQQSYRYIIETDKFLVMYPKNPDCAYHVLIVPKEHVAMLSNIPRNDFAEIGELVNKLDAAARQNLGESYIGFNLLSNNGGPAVHQAVPHAHVHIFLRTTHDEYDPVTEHIPRPIKEFTKTELAHLKELQSWF